MDFVGYDQHVVFQADFAQKQQFVSRPATPHGIVGITENQQARLRVGERRLQPREIDRIRPAAVFERTGQNHAAVIQNAVIKYIVYRGKDHNLFGGGGELAHGGGDGGHDPRRENELVRLEIEAVAFPAHEKGKGAVRFNEAAGSMAKDSVFNAASVVRRVTGLELSDYDLHINVVGGGNIDGPSAGVAILSAVTSALTGRPLRQDVAVTGEISLYGQVRPVGGVFEKAYGAKQAGMKTMIIPEENKKDIPEGHLGLDVRPVETAEEAFRLLFADGWTDTERKDANGNG